MAFCYGRQFRRIAAQAITADPDEMRLSIACLLPAREDGGARVLDLKSEADCELAPAVIVAAFFADLISGEEAANLLRQTENPAFRKQPLRDQRDDYARYGPISLDPEWRRRAGLPPAAPAPALDYSLWGPPLSSVQDTAQMSRCSAAKSAVGLVNNNENTSTACCDAADRIPEQPPP
jgi:hypothetical protein